MVQERKVLIIDNVHPLIPEELSAYGYTCDFFPDWGRQEILDIIGRYDGVIVRSRIRLDRELLSKAEKLTFIGRVGSGLENIDVAYAGERGIRCLNSPEGNRDAVAEHALGMLLALMNNMVRADRDVRAGRWIREGNRGTEIMGKTVGILGYGNTGSAFAKRLKGFGAEVISYDKYKTGYSDGNTRETVMEVIFDTADILSLHVPLTDETTYLVDAPFLSWFKKNIWLVNTARGKVVRTPDLVNALKSGKVRGAALDVLEYEEGSLEALVHHLPDDFRYLTQADNVILTPHIAGWTQESNVRLARVLVEKIVHPEAETTSDEGGET